MLLESMPVSMADGAKKKISDVQEGDYISSQNGAAIVIEIHTEPAEEILRIESEHKILFVSRDQIILTTNGWSRADFLNLESYILTADSMEKIRSIGQIGGSFQVYSLSLRDDNSFIADDVLMGDYLRQVSKMGTGTRNVSFEEK